MFATSVRYEGMKRLGLDYEAVKAIKPDIVYVHGAGYGADGPYAGEPAYDDLVQSASGLADLLPRTDGDPSPALSAVADRRQGLRPLHGPGGAGGAVPPRRRPARASSSRCRCWSA